MGKNTDKSKIKVVQDSATEYDVTITQNGVDTSFVARCPHPQQNGTGNHWEVEIYDLLSSRDKQDIRPFFEAHEMMGILKYDLQDWSRENLEIDLEASREEELQEILQSNFNSY